MRRECPVCSESTLPIAGLLFTDARCGSCDSRIGVHWVASTCFSMLIFAVTVSTTIMVLAQMGFYAALLWFPCPIGALSYVKAWLCPLEAKQQSSGH
jgi:uncharacterized protein (DUF983 family)